MAKQEATQGEIAQLRNKVVVEIERSLYAIEERDRALYHLLERGVLLACVQVKASHCITQLMKLKMVASEISQDVVALVTEVRAQQIDLLGTLQVLAEGLKTTA